MMNLGVNIVLSVIVYFGLYLRSLTQLEVWVAGGIPVPTPVDRKLIEATIDPAPGLLLFWVGVVSVGLSWFFDLRYT